MKRMLTLLLTLALCLGLSAPAFAAGSDFVIEKGVLTEYKGSDAVVTVPEGVTEIGYEAFFRVARKMTEVRLPQSLTKIGDSGFWGCTALTTIHIPAGVTEIGENAFASCQGLTELIIPDTVKTVGGYAFMDCRSLTEITLPDSVTTLGFGVFTDCTALRRVVLPNNPQVAAQWKDRTHDSLFSGCTALEEVANSPFAADDRRVQANGTVIDGWVNPGAYVEPQNEAITALSWEICAGIDSDYDKAHAIFRWVAGNVAYDYEHLYGRKASISNTAQEVLESRLAVCAGYARLTQALLQAQDIPALYVRGSGVNGLTSNVNHAWNLAFVEGRWVALDSTWGRTSALDEATGELRDGGELDERWFDPKELFFAQTHTAQSTFSARPEDIPSGWAQESVWAAICARLVTNDLQGAYTANITREAFCRLMVKLVESRTGKALPVPVSPFTDTQSPAVAAAYAAGIVKGASETSFNPQGSITRQEAAVMLARTARLLGLSAGMGETFADSASIASWAADGVAFTSGLTDSTGARVMGGTGGGFDPLGSYTREQAILTALRLSRCGQRP